MHNVRRTYTPTVWVPHHTMYDIHCTVYMCMCNAFCMCIHIHIHIYANEYIYIYMYITHIYIYIYIYIYQICIAYILRLVNPAQLTSITYSYSYGNTYACMRVYSHEYVTRVRRARR